MSREKVLVREDNIEHLPSISVLEMVVMADFALSVNVKTHIEMIPITTAAIFEAVDILYTVEVLNSSWRGTLSRFRNLTSDILRLYCEPL
jgi:peroxiredoxin